MRRVRIRRIMYQPNHPLVGAEGWLGQPWKAFNGRETFYIRTFYADGQDTTYPMTDEREWEYLSDRER